MIVTTRTTSLPAVKTRSCVKAAGRSICGLFALAAAGAGAQGTDDATSSGGRSFYLVPTLTVGATATDNVNLSGHGQAGPT